MANNNSASKKIGLNDSGQFCCLKTMQTMDGDLEEYSRFKFGDVAAIESLSGAVSRYFIQKLNPGGELREVFDRVKKDSEFIYIQAPGVRNVASSSNYLMAKVADNVNLWLAHNGYPTMIKKPVVRLASGVSNYAELSAQTRKNREKTTVSLLPISDYSAHPINVIFIDDVRVTGCTSKRAELHSLRGGAVSFNSIFAYEVDDVIANHDASIEHRLNQYSIKGGLDVNVSQILAHTNYQPVQRMLRLLLNSANRKQWAYFARFKIPEQILLRIYCSALSNDYHSISTNGNLMYAESLSILYDVLREKSLIDQMGNPC